MRHLPVYLICAISCLWSSHTFAEQPCDLVNYPTAERPLAAEGATKVHLGIAVVDLISIKDVEQTVTLDVLINVSWQDKRLSRHTGCRFPLKRLWHPDVQLVNSGDLTPRQPFELLVGEDGWLKGGFRLRGSIADPRSMVDFPFDHHTITLELMSLRYDASEVEFVVDESWTLRQPNLTIPDWDIGEVTGKVETTSLPRLDRVASVYKLFIPTMRQPQYYIYKIMFPLIMIVMMSWAVFWVDPKSLGPQMTLSATSMLTLVTFQFSMNDLMPRVGYFTKLDTFVLCASILVFLALVESTCTGYLASVGKHRTAKWVDRSSQIAYPIVLGLVVLLTLL